ncbi:MAG: 16S rRNA (cytosine(1402)-N(4))-methyltransferase RsmH [Gammaproteobacteria bacterium]|jgi:16S rRNA (cytosine1402-N4)-methyltransferase|nr:16S rRNA (cytosine(1402)-N(4))-methyltransferase RsmH [Gammaproteobacteria bacterium]MBT4462727.1 16S rRNA (cytosine(1402)-N(4))-methyltransferase RsmH [Gammaproteobacteria bacterium]MBT4654397.1 16S rRNA (cytosine(1402)-N(4))-methyltransferase RsmH [Gammaproteobacteria bacterium]MBT5116304.1 16S rRNA (cytosine(1402)-N(4))-methyltransferase RsmH [Gammaproteobacteria bacterium]MBT5761854.1 16S rRNA (cytosine(1402)-N(4))-methyltransferase RsmH [Gammaproteobacteria bacterium]
MNLSKHIPVMLEKSIDAMKITPSGTYVDATFGFGGHSKKILDYLDDDGRLYAVDKDTDAINMARDDVAKDKRFTLKHGCFSELENFSRDWGIHGSINGILFDLGVSSYHLDEPERGFSFNKCGPIDMRFNQSSGISACEWLETVDEQTLAHVIWKYGDERYSRRIARAIVHQRDREKISNTDQLAKIVDRAMPRNEKNKHNATRTFQAIRIFINKELEVLKDVLSNSYNILAPKGRLVLLTYHSLEDRVIKDFLAVTDENISTPRNLPIKSEFLKKMFNIVSKSIKPSKDEIDINPRSRSAKLNILEKANEDYV